MPIGCLSIFIIYLKYLNLTLYQANIAQCSNETNTPPHSKYIFGLSVICNTNISARLRWRVIKRTHFSRLFSSNAPNFNKHPFIHPNIYIDFF